MDGGAFRFHIGSAIVDYHGFTYHLNRWNSVCVTWGEGHMTQFFINGEASVKKIAPMVPDWQIHSKHYITVGQDQDSYGGGFEQKNAFTGFITDIHMWDHVISICQIHTFMESKFFISGNYLRWQDLDFKPVGEAKVEEKQALTALCP